MEQAQIDTLNLGDHVCIDPELPYLWATVVQIYEGIVVCQRPFLTHEDFITAGNKLQYYTGMEPVSFLLTDKRPVWVVRTNKEIK